MRDSAPGTARQEAERLVATALAAVRLVAVGAANRDSDAGCPCPVCRALAALREPDPRVVERLATRAGDLAAGVASLLRSASAGQHAAPSASTGHAAPSATDDQIWRDATRAGQTGAPRRPDDAWAAATRTDGDRPGRPPGT